MYPLSELTQRLVSLQKDKLVSQQKPKKSLFCHIIICAQNLVGKFHPVSGDLRKLLDLKALEHVHERLKFITRALRLKQINIKIYGKSPASFRNCSS